MEGQIEKRTGEIKALRFMRALSVMVAQGKLHPPSAGSIPVASNQNRTGGV
jgi:hypothetical protein